MSPTFTADPITDHVEAAPADQDQDRDEVVAEVLVEEISIDGMCGVY